MLNILIFRRFLLSLLGEKPARTMLFAMASACCINTFGQDGKPAFHTIGDGYTVTVRRSKIEGKVEDVFTDSTDMNNTAKPPADSLRMAMPLVALPLRRIKVNSRFGMRNDPMDRKNRRMHCGLDLAARYETVYSMLPGTVAAVSYSTNGGYYVTVNHNACTCSYLHLSKILVDVGQHVNAGQAIAVSGNSGKRTTGPHLHISCRLGNDGQGKYFDPMLVLGFVSEQLLIGKQGRQ